MEKIPITKAGFERLKRELEVLKAVSIPENIKDIEIARAQGDLSENAEYSAAKERQAFLHGKMQELENNLAMSNVIDLKKPFLRQGSLRFDGQHRGQQYRAGNLLSACGASRIRPR